MIFFFSVCGSFRCLCSSKFCTEGTSSKNFCHLDRHSSLPLLNAAISAFLSGKLYRNNCVEGEAFLHSRSASFDLFNSLLYIGVV